MRNLICRQGDSARYAAILGSLTFLFFLRVLGQALVAFFNVTFLPPMEQWYSGLIPYPILLSIQIIIVLAQVRLSVDLYLQKGFFVRRRPTAGRILSWFSAVYFLAMLARYIITMMLYPERRWFGGTIPIFFHWVLAAYLRLYGRYLSRGELSTHTGP
ncbi:MAG: hypothetical protein O7H40_15400 [Gammaproteobacteria bacterium]|nr:hypothetical protein [Gammaproteobacteria bacterium]